MLYIVATPIGNLADLSERAIQILRQVDRIVVEDSRHAGILLQHLQIRKPLIVLHDHNEKKQAEKILTLLQSGEIIALISDAGTPLISDPGFSLVRLAHENGIRVSPIPGPCALITAICASGLPTDKFIFEGFLPVKAKARMDSLHKLKNEQRTIIFYEAPHRIYATLTNCLQIFGENRQAVLARELTKLYETIQVGTLKELVNFVEFDLDQQKGEIVLIIAGHRPKKTDVSISQEGKEILEILLKELPLKQAVNLTAKITGCNKKVLYNYGLTI